MTQEEMEKMILENNRLLGEIQATVQKTATYIKWVRIMDFLKVLAIVVPIIAAWLYLPQIVNLFTAGYGDILLPGILK